MVNKNNDNANDLELLKQGRELIRPYCVPLINPGHYPPNDLKLGSGTFVAIGNVRGIITNEHVAELFYSQTKNHLWVPDADENLQELAFFLIIKMPEPDMAFILLDEASCNIIINKMNKQFLNLSSPMPDCKNKGCFWLIWGSVYEGRDYIKNPNKSRPYFYFKNAGPYCVVPDLANVELYICDYANFKMLIDKIDCPIRTHEKVPNKFDGMSGAVLWRFTCDENANIDEVMPMGLATFYSPKNKANKLICYGPNALYSFKSFVSVILNAQNYLLTLKLNKLSGCALR